MKKNYFKLLSLIVVISMVALSSCKKKSDEPQNNPSITVSPANQLVPSEPGGTFDFTVTTGSDWTASSDQTWCTVTPNGTGNGIITATYDANETTVERVATITVTVSGLNPVIVNVTQAAAGKLIEISGEISGNVTWTANKQYLLKGFVYVIDGAVLTIEPGTVIKGDKSTMGSLIIERGGKIIADGTVDNPIVFTSNAPVNYRNRGDWGGIILCGKAPVNNGDPQIEGGPRSHYGGSDPNDNSGVLRYVRIEYAGYPFQPDKEVNGLTFGGVGAGTEVDYVMVSFANDDSFEWFGGTVNCKHLIAVRGLDDDFDTDNGFIGKIQYGIAIRDKNVADVSGSNGCESDNDATGSTNIPVTHPIFCNMTLIGPRKDASTSNINANYKNAMHLRRNTQLSAYNSVFAGHLYGLLIDGTLSQTNAATGILQIQNTIISGCSKSSQFFNVQSGSTYWTVDSVANWFLRPAFANDTLNNTADLKLADAFNLDAPNMMPSASSPVFGMQSYNNPNLQNSFFTQENFIGAMGSNDWTTGWTNWNPQTTPYDLK